MENLSATKAERDAYVHNVEEALSRIASYKGVVGYFAIHPESGRVLKYEGFEDSPKGVKRYADKLRGLIDVAASTVRTLDWRDNMTFLRLSYGEMDILVAPDLEKQYTLVVVQSVEQ